MAKRIVELGAGTFDIRGDATSQATVPTLTASIAQASLFVGDVASLTTNLGGALDKRYLWKANGSPAPGTNNTATYDTSSLSGGETLTCDVLSGLQVVTTAGVTVLAAAALNVQYLGSVYDSLHDRLSTNPFTGTMPDLGADAADREIFVTMVRRGPAPTSIIMNGVTSTLYQDPGGALSCVFGRALIPAGSTGLQFTVNDPGTVNGRTKYFFYRVTGLTQVGTIFKPTDATDGVSGTINVAQSSALLCAALELGGGAPLLFSGVNEHAGEQVDLDSSDNGGAGFITGLAANAAYPVAIDCVGSTVAARWLPLE